jgi:hypothetical protein
MTIDQDIAASKRASDMRKQISASERHSKKMLAIWKKAISGGSRPRFVKITSKRSKSGGGRATRGAGSWKKEGRTPALLLKIHSGGINGDSYSERQKKNDAKFLVSNMLGQTAQRRKLEFALDAARHPRVDPINLFVHTSISRPANENLTQAQWIVVVTEWLKNLGAEGCQYVATRHSNTNNDHIHVVFSRSKPDGTLVSLSNNRWDWREALRQTELGLGITTADHPRNFDLQTPTSDRMVSAQRRSSRLNKRSCFIAPQKIELVLSQSTSIQQFMDGLQVVGIDFKQAMKSGHVTGSLFQTVGADQWLAGSSISRDFSLPRIHARLAANLLSLHNTEAESQLQHRKQQEQSQRNSADAQQCQNHYERDI